MKVRKCFLGSHVGMNVTVYLCQLTRDSNWPPRCYYSYDAVLLSLLCNGIRAKGVSVIYIPVPTALFLSMRPSRSLVGGFNTQPR